MTTRRSFLSALLLALVPWPRQEWENAPATHFVTVERGVFTARPSRYRVRNGKASYRPEDGQWWDGERWNAMETRNRFTIA